MPQRRPGRLRHPRRSGAGDREVGRRRLGAGPPRLTTDDGYGGRGPAAAREQARHRPLRHDLSS